MSLVKKILKLITYITLCIFLTLGALPSILSTESGKSWLLNLVNETIPGKIDADTFQLAWFGDQTIRGFKLKDPHGFSIVTISELHVNQSLASLLYHRFNKLPLMKIYHLEGILEVQEKTINVARALGFKHDKISDDFSSVQFYNVNGFVGAEESTGRRTATIRGNIRNQNEQGNFHAIVVEDNEPIHASLEFENFPVVFFDYLKIMAHSPLSTSFQDMIGNLLQMKFVYHIEDHKQHFALDAASPLLDMKLSGNIVNNLVKIDQQAVISWKLPSTWINRSIEKIMKKNAVQIDRMLHTLVKIEEFEIPRAFFSKKISNNLSPSTFVLKAEAEILENEITNTTEDGNITLNGVFFSITAPYESKNMDLLLEAKASHQNNPIQFKFNGAIAKPLHITDLKETLLREMRVKLKAVGINDFLGFNSSDTNRQEGPNGNGVVSIDVNQGNFVVEGYYQSPQLQMRLPRTEGLIAHNQVTLTKPAELNFQIDQSLANRYLGLNDHLTFLNGMDVTLKFKEMLLDHFFFVFLEAEINPFRVYLKSLDNALDISKLTFDLDTTKERVGSLALNIAATSQEGLFKEIFGESLKAEIHGKVSQINLSRLDVHDLKMHLISDIAQVNVIGDLDTKKGFHLKEKLEITFPTVQKITNMLTPSLGIRPNSIITFSINQTEDVISFDKMTQCFLSGYINVPELVFTEQNVAVKNMMIPWKICGATNKIEIGFSGSTSNVVGRENGSFQGNVVISDFIQENHLNFDHLKVRSGFQAKQFPLSLMEIFGDQLLIKDLLEERFDLSWNMDLYYDTILKGSIKYSASGEEINTSGSIKVDDKISFSTDGKPTQFRIAITPKRFEALRRLVHQKNLVPAKITLLRDGILEGQLNHLTFFPSEKAQYTLENSSLELNMYLKNIRIKDNDHNIEYDFPLTKMTLTSEQLQNKIDFIFLSEESSKGNENGKISVKGYVENVFSPEGQINLWNSNINLSGHANKLPISLFTRIIRFTPTMDKSIEALFGKMIDVDITLGIREWNGPVFAKISGSNGELFIDGNIKDGTLRLMKPLEAKISVTPELGTYVFADLLPLFGSITESDSQISVLINPKGFKFPVYDFQFSKINITGGTLSLGKVKFKNEGPAATLLNVLNHSDYSHLSLWCTPCHFNVVSGVLGIARMDILVTHRYPIALWGKVDFIRDKVNLTIGLSGKTISKAFNMNGIKNETMVTLPLKGSIGKASINKTKAITKLASIAAKKAGDPGSLLIGTVLDIATGNILDQDVPKPTTDPLPWDVHN